MKKIYIVLLLLVTCFESSFADEWTDENGIIWNYTNVEGGVQLNGASNYGDSFSIPSTIDGKDIKSINNNAFEGCSSLTSVDDLSVCTSIGKYAFYNCFNITSVDLSTCTSVGEHAFHGCSSLTNVDLSACASIGNYAFYGCSCLTSVGDLSTCTSIDDGAFQSCSSLTSVGDLSACTSIGDYAFESCSSLTSVGDLSACISIRSYAFYQCSNITSIDLSNCTSVGERAFSGCSSLTSVGDLSACTSIGNSAFRDCSSLNSVGNLSACISIGSSAFADCSGLTSVGDLSACTSIGNWAFDDCSNLTSVGNLSACTSIGNSAFQSCSSLTSVGDLSACISIRSYAFNQCSNITSIDLSNCTSVGERAFSNCSSLTSVGTLSACTFIDNSAFYGCSSLTNVDLSACASIGNYAFYGCSSLTSVGDLSACTSIGDYAFENCSNLTSVDNLSAYTSISDYAFSGCSSLTNVDLSACASIGNYAFYGCSSLTSVGDLSACTSIGNSAFRDCSSLNSVGDLSACISIGSSAFSGCSSLTSVGDLSACTSIGNWAFADCSNLTSVGNLSACTSIGDYAFESCSNLTSVGNLSACTSIGNYAFFGCRKLTEIRFCSIIPPTLNDNPFRGNTTIFVPESAIEAYRTAENWSELAVNIIPNNVKTNFTGADKVITTVLENGSGLQSAIGEQNLANVMSLEIEGDINSYDIMVMRNKMPNLHVLDLTNANIVANNYQYYSGYGTRDNILNGHEFDQQYKLTEVKLPKSIKSIGSFSFYNSSLNKVTMYEGVKSIGSHAFASTPIDEVTIPEGVTIIDDFAFYYCHNLKNIVLPSSLKTIYDNAFESCSGLNTITLPDGLTRIYSNAFSYCSSLTEVVIPGAITSIGDYAFIGCPLKSVKTKLVDPFTIGQNTFSAWTTATLYVPMTEEWDATYQRYYWDTQWGQFSHIEGWDPTINDFYIDNDYDLEGGTIGGEDNKPNADMNDHCGFHVKKHGHQKFHHVHVKHNGNTSGSVIGDETNLNADRLYSDIQVSRNRWYFFSFPFDIKISDIEAPGNWVFRYYDGKERAEKARGGWKNLPKNQEYLKAGTGYIFQTNTSGTLVIPVDNPDFSTDNKQPELATHTSSNTQDASWNFVGNPYLSYYMLEDLDFTAPITVWNGSSYEAVRPGDDDYLIQPYQAFFVQKPSSADLKNAGFDPSKRTTYTKGNNRKNNAKALRAKAKEKSERLLVNLVISDGQNTDKTRIVFNDKQKMEYEMDCDASKFISTEDVPQIYSVYGNANYAINERPNASREVQIGFSANTAGTYAISATRMDTPMLLKDAVTGMTFDLANGDYSFESEAGTFNNRFLLVGYNTTGIENMTQNESDAIIYDLNGKRMSKAEHGVMIINGTKTIVE